MSLNAQASRKLRAENRAVSISPTAKAPFSLGMGLWRVCTGTPKCQTCTGAVGLLEFSQEHWHSWEGGLRAQIGRVRRFLSQGSQAGEEGPSQHPSPKVGTGRTNVQAIPSKVCPDSSEIQAGGPGADKVVHLDPTPLIPHFVLLALLGPLQDKLQMLDALLGELTFHPFPGKGHERISCPWPWCQRAVMQG